MISARSLKYRRSLHIGALAVVMAVFPLIWMGGLVTSHGVGMSVPDWPNSYGYNMFLFPPSKWLGGVFFEHTHRLLGTLAGFLAILLTLMAWGPSQGQRAKRLWGWSAIGLAIASIASAVAAILITRSAASSVQLQMALPQSKVLWSVNSTGFSSEVVKYAPHVPVLFISLTLIAGMAWLCRRREPRRWVRWLTVTVLGTIIIQGILGGLRVDLMSVKLAMIHGCFAQAVFCLVAFAALATSRWWNVGVYDFRIYSASSKSLKVGLILAALATGVIYLQLIAGAIMRHNGAGLAIPTLPLAFGHWLPPTDSAGVDAANQLRAWQYELPPATLEQMWMHFTHRIGAIFVSAAILSLAGYVLIWLRRERAAVATVVILLVLLVTQVTLGILVVWYQKPADLTSIHVAVGALTLMTASMAMAVLWRLKYRRQQTARELAARPDSLTAAA